jgi:esterase/lipase superfamily enzyme
MESFLGSELPRRQSTCRNRSARPGAQARGITIRHSVVRALILLVAGLLLAGCGASVRDVLIPTQATAPGTSEVELLVATTRSAKGAEAGEMFTGERSHSLSFADIAVSLPPDAQRKIGDVQWPARLPADPARDFVTTKADALGLPMATARLHALLAKTAGRRVLVFVHGFNNRFDEAVYRFAQIVHDSRAAAVPLLFTWPSRGKLLAYTYDRESATYSRDALEDILQALARDPQVGEISILAHSMGNWLAIEALRQMSIRNRGLPKKIAALMLAAPDVDVDVFQTEIADIKAPSTNFSLFVSQDDRALAASRHFWGDVARVGAIDPGVEPYREILASEGIKVFDLTKLKSDDDLRHSKFASSPEVVRLIGERLVDGQPIEEDGTDLGDRVRKVATGAATTLGAAAALAVTAPLTVVSGSAHETLGDRLRDVGDDVGETLRSTGDITPLSR